MAGWSGAWGSGPYGDANQEVDPALLNQSATTFTPQVYKPQTVSPGLITQAPLHPNPKIGRQSVVPLLDQSAVTFAPGGARTVNLTGVLDQSATTFAPSTTPLVVVALLDQSAATFAPQQVVRGNFTLAAPLLDQSAVTIAPSMSAVVTPGLINQAATTFAFGSGPVVSFGGTVAWDSPDVHWDDAGVVWDSGAGGSGILDQSGTTFAPQAKLKVTVGLLDQSATTIAPSVGAKTISVGLIDQSAVVFAPQANLKVTVGLLDNSATTTAFDNIQTARSITPGLINQSATTIAPSVNPKEVDTPLIDQSGVVFLAQVNQKVSPALLDNAATTFAPFVGPVVVPDLLDQSAVTFIPSLERVQPDLLDNSAAVFTPERVINSTPQTVRFDDDPAFFLDQSATVFAPNVGLAGPQVINLGFIDQAGQTIAPRFVNPTIPIILLRARYMPEITLRAKHDPIITKRAQEARQG